MLRDLPGARYKKRGISGARGVQKSLRKTAGWRMSMHEVLVTRNAKSEKVRWCEGAPRRLVESCIRSALDIPSTQQILCVDSKGAPVDVLTAPNKSAIRIVDMKHVRSKSSSESEQTTQDGSSTEALVRKTVMFDLTDTRKTNAQRDGHFQAIVPPVRSGEDSIAESDHVGLSSNESHDHDYHDHPDHHEHRHTLAGRFRTFSKALMRDSVMDDEQHQGDRLYADFGGDSFQRQLLRLERIDAHLSNERTWLSFLRWSFVLVGVALRVLVRSVDHEGWESYCLYISGGLMACCAVFAWLIGWARYKRTKRILRLRIEALNEYYKSVTLGHDGYMMILSVFTFVVAVATVSLVHLQ